jgi:phosphoribosylanthranilate isomerase
MPSGPGVISEEQIAEIAAIIPPGVASFLLTSKQDARSIIEQQLRTRVNTIQICDNLGTKHYLVLRSALPGVALVQVIHVRGRESVDEARAVAPHVNAILLDSGNQSLAVKELGGTGRTHDWTVSREIREAVDVPVFLAGGLNAGNVTEALDRVRPYALDLCSGVRTHGKLDEAKVSAFFQRVREWTIGNEGE